MANDQLALRVLRLTIAGVQPEEIAELLKVKRSDVKLMVQSPMFLAMVKVEKAKLRDLLAESIPEKLDALSHNAVEVYREEMEQTEDHGARLRAADSVMDRGKFPKRTQIDNNSTLTITLPADKKEQIEAACKEAQQALPAPPKSSLKHISTVMDQPEDT